MTAAKRNSKTRKDSQFNRIAVVGLGCSFDQNVEVADFWRLGPSADALSDLDTVRQPIEKLASAIANAVLDAEPLSSLVAAASEISISLLDDTGTIDGASLKEHLRSRIPFETSIRRVETLVDAVDACASGSTPHVINVIAAVDRRAVAVALVEEELVAAFGGTSLSMRPRIYAVVSNTLNRSAQNSSDQTTLLNAVEQITAGAQISISEVEMLQVSRRKISSQEVARFDVAEQSYAKLDPLQTIGVEGGETSALECLFSIAFSLYHKVLVPAKKQRVRGEQEIYPWVHGQIHKLVPKETRDRLLGDLSGPRIACLIEETVASNCNALLLEEIEDSSEVSSLGLLHKWDSELILLAAPSHSQLANDCAQLINLLEVRPDLTLLAMAAELADRFKYIVSNAAGEATTRAALIVSSIEDLKLKLSVIVDTVAGGHSTAQLNPNVSEDVAKDIYMSALNEVSMGKTAFILPGLGAAYPNMLSELCVHFPEVRAAFDFVDHLAKASDREQNIQSNPDTYPSRRIFSQAAARTKKPAETAASLATMDSAVVTVLMSEWALFKLFQDLGVSPDILVGCSTGEFAALSMCGTTDILDTATLFYRLSTAVARSVPQDQLADLRSICVYADYDTLKEHLTEFQSVYLSADFAPSQFILSGDTRAIEEVTRLFTGLNKTVHKLPVAIPYHTPLVEGKIDLENNELVSLQLNVPQVETWCCSIAGALPDDTEFIKGITTELFTHPIQLKNTVRKLYDAGVRKFVEMGPRGNLTPFVLDTLEGKPHLAVSANTSRGSAVTQLLHVLAALASLGAPVNPDLLFVRRRPRLFIPQVLEQDVHASPPPTTQWAISEFESQQEGVESIPLDEDHGEALVLANYMSGLAAVHSRMVAVQHQAMQAYMSVFDGQQLHHEGPDGQLALHYEHDESQASDSFDREADSAVIAQPQTIVETQPAVFFDQSAVVEEPYIEASAQPVLPRPFMHGARVKRTDNTVSVEISLSPKTHKFLLDHAIGGEVLTGSVSERVYLVPLTVMLEIMAEAAAEFFPGQSVVAISNARAYKRIRVGANGVSLIVRSKAQKDRTALVEIADEEVLAKCEVTFADQYPTQMTPQILGAQDGRKSKICELYSERTMFHGPRMQAVASIDSVGSSEITTTFELVDAHDWFSFTQRPQFLIDPLILDNGTQLTLYFLQEHDKTTNALLPFMLERLSLYAPPGKHSGQLGRARAHMRQASAVATEADIEILSPEGMVLYKFHGLSSRRICLPEQWTECVLSPATAFLSEQIEEINALNDAFRSIRVSRLDGSCLPEEEVARTWCLDYILNPQETPAYNKLNGMRKREWLLGRIAAKDSVRRLMKERYGLSLTCADVIIDNLPSGQPIATGSWQSDAIENVNLSISHKGEVAVALAALGTVGGAGIDIEEVLEREDGFEDLAFNVDDVALLVQNSPSQLGRHKIATIMWSAKESVGKALGMNLGQQRLSLTVKAMRLSADGPSNCTVVAKRSDSVTSTHDVTCICRGDLVVAVTVGNQEKAVSSERA